MIKAEDFKWLDRVYHLFHLGSYLCLSGALTDCFLPLNIWNMVIPILMHILKDSEFVVKVSNGAKIRNLANQ